MIDKKTREAMYNSAEEDILMVTYRISIILFSYSERCIEPTIAFNITKIPYLFPEYGLHILLRSTLYSLELMSAAHDELLISQLI